MDERPGPVLVTGANSGIGLASSLRMAGEGWDVWGTVRSEEKGAVLSHAAREAEVAERVHPLVLDVSDHHAVVDAFPELPDFYGVVNNAGYSEVGAVEEVPAERIKAQLDVNLVAPAVVSSCALPGMRRRGEGRIVMISSIAGRASLMPLNAWYHASKFGLEALSDVLRMEVSGFGVKVVLVEPGFFRTEIETRASELSALGAQRTDSPYVTAYRRVGQILASYAGSLPEPDLVAQAISTAMGTRRPKRRYVVGLDARAVVAAQPFLPRGIVDAVARVVADLPSAR